MQCRGKEKVAAVREALEEEIAGDCISKGFVFRYGGYVRPEAFGLELKDWLCVLVDLMS